MAAGTRRGKSTEPIGTVTPPNTTNTESVEKETIASKRDELNMIRHTETIDRLVLQNKNLQKDLFDAVDTIDDMKNRLVDQSVRISKNMLYIFFAVIFFVIYLTNQELSSLNTTMIESKNIMQQYRNEIEKIEMYKDILKDRINKNKE